MENYLAFSIVLIPLLFFIIQSYRERKNANTLIRFFQYGEDLRPNSFFATLAASNSGLSCSIYLFVIYGYFYGIGVFPWVFSFWLLTQFMSVFTIRRVEKLTSHEKGFLSCHGTLHEFLGVFYESRGVRIAAASLSLICYLGIVACELILAYEVFRAVIPNSSLMFGHLELIPAGVTALLALLVISYTATSGFRAVIRTDMFQLALMLTMLLLLWFIFALDLANFHTQYSAHFSTDIIPAMINPIGEGVGSFLFFFVFMNFLFWMIWWPSAMDQWHRCAASQQPDIALDKKFGTIGWVSCLYLGFLSLTFLTAGAFLKAVVIHDGGETAALFHLIAGFYEVLHMLSASSILSSIVVGIIAAGLMAAVVSTLDSYIIVAVQSLVSDILITRKYGKTLLEADSDPLMSERYLSLSRKIVVSMLFIILPSAFVISMLADVFTMIYTFFSFMMALIPSIFLALWHGKQVDRGKPVIISIVVGGLWTVCTSAYLITKIEALGRADKYEEMLFFYNLLYANPTITACITFIAYLIAVFLIVPKNSKLTK